MKYTYCYVVFPSEVLGAHSQRVHSFGIFFCWNRRSIRGHFCPHLNGVASLSSSYKASFAGTSVIARRYPKRTAISLATTKIDNKKAGTFDVPTNAEGDTSPPKWWLSNVTGFPNQSRVLIMGALYHQQ